MFHLHSLRLAIALLIATGSMHAQTANPPALQVTATSHPYITAMGKGRGVIFRVQLSVPAAAGAQAIRAESLFLNGRAHRFTARKTKTGISMEVNYLKNVPQPVYTGTNSPVKEHGEITDPVIMKKQYYPSWVVVTYAGKKVKLAIAEYKEINEKQ